MEARSPGCLVPVFLPQMERQAQSGHLPGQQQDGVGPGSFTDFAPLHPSLSTLAALPGPHSPQVPAAHLNPVQTHSSML